MKYEEERRYLGNMSQLFRVNEYRMIGGRGDGIHAFDVRNGAEMDFTCVADRCMDIHYLRYRGHNLGFLTSAGDVAPQYYDDKEFGWLKSFTAGFMTTCGLKTIGLPSYYNGRHYGIHGRIGNAPAQFASATVRELQQGPMAQLHGVMQDSLPGSETLTLARTINTSYKDNRIYINDIVKNIGYQKSMHMLLYHFNIGYPLLSENSMLYIPSAHMAPRDDNAAAHMTESNLFIKPMDDFKEMCYYHKLKTDSNGKTFVAIFNPDINAGVAIHFDTLVLDHFVQWRQLGSGYYTTGLEPCNATIDGVEDAINNGTMKYLEPNQEIQYNITIELLGNQKSYNELVAKGENYV